MFFEGSEKKAEIIMKANAASLLEVDDTVWAEMVEACHAQILSSIGNDQCKAFLLSESSLFVWPERLLILTCGNTRLIHSIEYFLNRFGVDQVDQVIYQRKNEYFALAQPTCFGDDVKRLASYVPGKAYRFGELDNHHNYVFHQANDFKAEKDDKTYELMVYQICPLASEKLTEPDLTREEIRSFLRLSDLLPDYQLDDFVFDPYGYSLNALNGDHYLTIHVTPQEESSYISFEASFNLIKLMPVLLMILAPKSFDLLSYNEPDFEALLADCISDQYVAESLVKKDMDNGYVINYATFIRPSVAFEGPQEIDVSGEHNAL